MATTGERLVEISTLSTGTALQHLLNVDYGGTGETIYVQRAITGLVMQGEIRGVVHTEEIAGVVVFETVTAEIEEIDG